MSDRSRLLKLAGHLQAEIRAAKAGDSQGQFPILDLIGNLRDEAGGELPALVTLCAEAWERMVRLVESGQPFQSEDVSWLQELLARVLALIGLADSSTAAAGEVESFKLKVESIPAAPRKETCNLQSATCNSPELAEEAPLNLNLAADAELLREFITESREHLDHIEQGVLVLENSPGDAEVLNTIFRAFHTFKGGAGFLNLLPIIRGVFQKMSRVLRDIGAKRRKKVNLVTSGEDTELDRTVVEELNDPLLHMIRNSMDHGIELPEKRAVAGKPAPGTLTLRAYHQGGNIVVEIEDDGAGLNKEKFLQKAIERGLAKEGEPLTDEEIFHFIFAAGFSTADKVTDLSGRGVGLDVVRRNIERLRGRVEISSVPGQGTKFQISLPLTLAIIDGFIVKVGAERYILPTLSVRESFRPQPGMVSRVQNRAEVVNVRGRIIPLLRLNDLFGISSSSREATDGIVVVVEAGADLRCLLVDGLLHKQEVVIKNLNDMLVRKNKLLAGAAILGDGLVGLILDVNALVHLEMQPQFTRTG